MEGLRQLMENGGHPLTEVGLLQVAMSQDPRVDITVKRQLLYGLLLPRGLTVIMEDGFIIAPFPEMPIIGSRIHGVVRFLREFGRKSSIHPLDLRDICKLKKKSTFRVHQLLHFLLSKLAQLDPSDTLLSPGLFHLKSLSSVINELLFGDKKLENLFSTTVLTSRALKTLQSQLDGKGAIFLEEDILSGNCGRVYRYVRVLQVELEDRSTFTVPVCYEIIHHSSKTSVFHNQSEFDQFCCSLGKGKKNILARSGFTIVTLWPKKLLEDE